jgi:hypothetical protein
MVLIFGQPSDPCASLTYQYLRRPGTGVVFVDDSQLLTTAGLSWSPGRSPHDSFLTVHASRIPLADVSGVLARIQQPVPCPSDVPAEDRQYITSELQATLQAFFNSLPCDDGATGGKPLL